MYKNITHLALEDDEDLLEEGDGVRRLFTDSLVLLFKHSLLKVLPDSGILGHELLVFLTLSVHTSTDLRLSVSLAHFFRGGRNICFVPPVGKASFVDISTAGEVVSRSLTG